jgi:glucan phosphoethanolaminetransferase (alkaline phosphatase superfamily)
MATESQSGFTPPAGFFNGMMQILKKIEDTSEKGAATILFIVGISLFVVVYGIKFFSIPLSKEMTTAEFVFSIVVAMLLVLFGAATRLFLFYITLDRYEQVGKELVEFEDKVEGRRTQTTETLQDQQTKLQAAVS